MRLRTILSLVIFIIALSVRSTAVAQNSPSNSTMHETDRSLYQDIAKRLLDSALLEGRSYDMLRVLTTRIGARLSGSRQAELAVEWGKKTMEENGLENVRLQPVTVPHWERGAHEEAMVISPVSVKPILLRVLALGGSVATPEDGVEAEVIEVKSLDEARALGEKGRGKIVFFNRPMDPSRPSTFDAYGGAVDQRVGGASAGASVGAVAVLVRSMSTANGDFPHTGMLRYDAKLPEIPAAALGVRSADRLSRMIHDSGSVRLRLKLSCRTLPDAASNNVIGEIVGSEKPDEVIVLGAHLDSWDVGQGAHDDGAGCVQVIEALRLLKQLGLRPKRTIRAVLFMNEENGLRGGLAYADSVAADGTRHIAAVESDRGGFAPRGFFVESSADTVSRLGRWSELFTDMGADRFVGGGGGADIGPLKKQGALNIGLAVESHRYFDYHHSQADTFDKVNDRELELGAASMALLAYLISEEGI